ncbi:E5, partial [Tursiops truncatus papillomavirus 1]
LLVCILFVLFPLCIFVIKSCMHPASLLYIYI